MFIYLSYESESNNYVQFDDFKVTHTKTRVVQYNEYYPFGLQTANSWTRDNSTNNFLYNAGSELNNTTANYEMFYREYDPALGRMNAVDPMASKYASLTPYNYAFNDPVFFNDPLGDDASDPSRGQDWWRYTRREADGEREYQDAHAGMYGSMWNYETYGGGFQRDGVGGSASLAAAEHAGAIKAFLRNLFKDHDISFSSNGSGFWVKYTGLDESTLDLENSVLASPIVGNFKVNGISRDHFRTMMGAGTQSIHRGHAAFMANPYGAAFMGFVTGGPLLGGGGGMLARAGARQLAINSARTTMQYANRIGSQALTNVLKYGARNASIEFSTQVMFNGFDKVDFVDVGISTLSGNSFVFSGIAGGLFDYSISDGFSTAYGKGIYQTSVDVGTGIFFGGANHVTGMIPGTKNIGKGLSYGLDFTVDLYGSLFNYTLSQKP